MLWWQKGIIYQIYPRSFLDCNCDGIGDIQGIISKLDYLNDGTEDSLGIDAIWISPIYMSPMKDFGYDISNYKEIDPIFGTNEELDILVEEAHKRNIKIIMDLVVNHTSDKHPWFIESRSSKDSPKRDWYIWGKKPLSNWFSEFSFRNSWVLDENTNEFYYAFFTKEQPELNWRNQEVRKAIYDLIRYWFERGIDGFRVDVVNYYIIDDQYRNNPWRIKLNPIEFQNHIYDRNRPETHEIVKEFRKIADEYQDKLFIGEVYTTDSKLAISYQGKGKDELHLAFNFNFLFQKWSAQGFYKKIEEWYRLMPEGGWPNFTLSNHDQIRHFTRYNKNGQGEQRAKVVVAMLLTLKGTPTLYYGEEIGMENLKMVKNDLQDPIGVKYWPFFAGRDGERSPMQWDDSINAGFTDTEPWLPVHNSYQKKNVAVQRCNEKSLLSFYKKLIWLRKKSKALSIGDIEFFYKGESQVLGFRRCHGTEIYYVYLNFSNKAILISKIENEKNIYFGTHRKSVEVVKDKTITLAPYEVLILGE